jgi:hypothetical protein
METHDKTVRLPRRRGSCVRSQSPPALLALDRLRLQRHRQCRACGCRAPRRRQSLGALTPAARRGGWVSTCRAVQRSTGCHQLQTARTTWARKLERWNRASALPARRCSRCWCATRWRRCQSSGRATMPQQACAERLLYTRSATASVQRQSHGPLAASRRRARAQRRRLHTAASARQGNRQLSWREALQEGPSSMSTGRGRGRLPPPPPPS